MNIKSSIGGIQHTCINFLILIIITKIECWPVFKQDPRLNYFFLMIKHFQLATLSRDNFVFKMYQIAIMFFLYITHDHQLFSVS